MVDDKTFTIKTTEPVSNLPVRLGYSAFAPLPDSFFADPKAFEAKPIGAGPFKLDSKTNTEFVLSKFADYSGDHEAERGQADLPDLPGPGGGLRRRRGRQPRLHRRQQHSAKTSSSATRTRATSLTATRSARPAGSPGSRSLRMIRSSRTTPDLRKAISRAIDRDLITKQIFNDTGHPGDRLGVPGGGRLQGRRLR